MKDRLPKYPNRVKLTPVSGDLYQLERADEPIQEGTPTNKATLLTDETAAQIWPDEANRPANPTVDNALARLAEPVSKVGDLLATVRTDLGDKWILCNGQEFGNTPEYQDLYNMLPGASEWTPLSSILSTTISSLGIEPLYGEKGWQIYALPGANIAYVYLREEAAFREISPGLGIIGGIDWDGERWVLCIVESTALKFYTSADLETWSLAANLTTSNSITMGVSAVSPRFLYDGAAYRFLCQRYGYQIGVFFTIPRNFSSKTEVRTTIYLGYSGGYSVESSAGLVLYAPGSTSAAAGIQLNTSGSMMRFGLLKYDDDLYFAAPISGVISYANRITVFRKSTASFTNVFLTDLFGTSVSKYLRAVYYKRDTDEFILDFRDSTSNVSSSTVYTMVHLRNGLDPLTAANYYAEPDTSVRPSFYLPTDGSPEATEDRTQAVLEQMSNGTTKNYRMKVLGPGVKFLPMISDEAYTYIKATTGGTGGASEVPANVDPGAFALIETVTIAQEGVTVIERTQEPDGTPYKMRGYYLSTVAPKEGATAAYSMHATAFADSVQVAHKDSVMVNPSYDPTYVSWWLMPVMGLWTSANTASASGEWGGQMYGKAYAAPKLTTDYPYSDKLRLAILSGQSFPVGTVIRIYGVRT